MLFTKNCASVLIRCPIIVRTSDTKRTTVEMPNVFCLFAIAVSCTVVLFQGNDYYKKGKLNEAIECYTRGINCDPTNAVIYANRAMSLLKQEK